MTMRLYQLSYGLTICYINKLNKTSSRVINKSVLKMLTILITCRQNRSFSNQNIKRYAGTLPSYTNMTHTNADEHTLHNNRIQCTLFVLEKPRKPFNVAKKRKVKE